MSTTAPSDPGIPVVDIRDVEEWKEPPKISFDQFASLQIARWVLMIFAGVYLLCFVMAFVMFCMSDATYSDSLELGRFMLGSILPLVTLAVGFYLGDRRSGQD